MYRTSFHAFHHRELESQILFPPHRICFRTWGKCIRYCLCGLQIVPHEVEVALLHMRRPSVVPSHRINNEHLACDHLKSRQGSLPFPTQVFGIVGPYMGVILLDRARNPVSRRPASQNPRAPLRDGRHDSTGVSQWVEAAY